MKLQILYLLYFLCLNIPTFSQVSDVISLKKINDKGQTDFYHITNFGNTEKKSITFIAQDSIGQMWFATKDGVIRYDTKNFHNYKHDAGDPQSIGGNFIERIFTGKDGSVWIGTEPAVLSKYNPETDNFETIPGINGRRIKGIQQDSDGLYWITSNTTIYSYNDQSKELKKYHYKDKKVGLDRLLITSDNRIWMTTNSGFILEFSPKTSSFRKVQLLDKNNLKWSQNTTAFSAFYFVEDHEHYIWISTPYGYLLRYNPQNENLTKFVFQDLKDLNSLDYNKLTVMFIMEDDSHDLWFGTWFNGMYKLSGNRKEVTHFMPYSDNPNTLSNNIIHSGFQDNAGYMWFGTEFAGLNILKKNKKFDILSYDAKNKNSLPNTVYNAVATDNNNQIWLATDGKGLYYFNKNTPEVVKHANSLFGLSDNSWVLSLLYDSKGFLWVGSNQGLFKFNPTTKENIHYKYEKDNYNSINSNVITGITEDKNQNIWIGTNYGVTKFDVNNNKFYRFIHDKSNPKSLSDNYVRSMYCDSNNNIWIGTFIGLNKFNPITGDFTVYKQDVNDNNSINANRINSIHEAAGNLWVGTQGGGLNQFNYESQKFQYHYSKNGFPFDNIKGINSDLKGNLWISSSNNIIKFNTKTKQYITYGKSDGLENTEYIKNVGSQGLEFVSDFSYKDKQGYLYFGGVSGMCFFHPDSLPQNTHKPPLIINKFLVQGKPYEISENITLESNQNYLDFSITALNYIQPDKNQYAFYLENYDDQWQYKGVSNKTSYSNLPKGEYVLHYKASNNDKIWNENSTPIHITILPVFYKSNLFYFLLLMFFVVLGFAFFLYKLYLKRKLEKQKKEFRYSTSKLSDKRAKEINDLLVAKLNTTDLYLNADLSLHKLAKIIGVKPNNLSQVINQVHNRNFNEFINLYRLEEAKKLLTETYLKIEAVAYDSGFNSLSTFNTFFKKEVGITPSKYRKTNK